MDLFFVSSFHRAFVTARGGVWPRRVGSELHSRHVAASDRTSSTVMSSRDETIVSAAISSATG